MDGKGAPQEKKSEEERERMSREIGVKEQRKLRSRREEDRGAWYGLGMFGLVGWSVAIPTLLGIAIGVWVDMKVKSRYSWTLMGLAIGVILGCLNAWFWVKRESGFTGGRKGENHDHRGE